MARDSYQQKKKIITYKSEKNLNWIHLMGFRKKKNDNQYDYIRTCS